MSLLDSFKNLAGKIGSGRSYTHDPVTGSECPHETDVLAYSENRLTRRRREQLESHFAGCDGCRDFLALFVRNSDDATEPDIRPLSDSALKDQTARVLTYIKEDDYNRRRAGVINRPAGTIGAGQFFSSRQGGAGAGFFVSTRQLVTVGLILCAIGAATAYFVTRGESKNEIAMQAVAFAIKDKRLIEPRLSGGLPYSPYTVDTRGAVGVADKNPQAEAQFERAQAEMQFAENPSASAEDRLTLARVWLAQGEPDQVQRALDILKQLEAGGMRSPELLNDAGVAMLLLGRYAEAIDYFDQALAKSPGAHEAMFNKAMAEQQSGNIARAREDWKKFIETSSDEKWKDEARRYLEKVESQLHQ